MHIVVSGGTGFLGQSLIPVLLGQGHAVTVLTRDANRVRQTFGTAAPVAARTWSDDRAWRSAVAEADAVVHLAGESVAGERWTPEYKKKIEESRIITTNRLVEAGPRVLISASAVGYYGDGGETILTETAPSGNDFLAEVCVRWEAAALQAAERGTRVALVRVGLVLGKGGGSLEAMLNPPMVPFSPWKLGAGGPLGNGKQWMPWVHVEDVARLFAWCLENPQASGPYNAVAPNPVRNAEFSAVLGRTLNRPSVVPVPAFALRLLLGEFTDFLLASQRVVPKRAPEQGFTFYWNDLEPALRDILR